MIIVLVDWPTTTGAVRPNQEWRLYEDDEREYAEAQYELWRSHPNMLCVHMFDTEVDDDTST